MIHGNPSAADRETFLKACILFWILGASDGHAKNFSLFLGPVGSYRLAPIYDVLSVYPWLGKTGDFLPVQKLKMAMAVRAELPVDFPARVAAAILDGMTRAATRLGAR